MKVQICGTIILSIFLLLTFNSQLSTASDKWQGVDKLVVEKLAKEYGREARKPFINPNSDLLLFLFLLAGTIGGFAAGYYWRVLSEQRMQNKNVERTEKTLE